jgi:hypothetical protein
MKDFIKHDVSRFIYLENSQNELSDLLNRIYNESYDLFKISDNTRKICRKLSWTKLSDRYLTGYTSLQ